MPEAPDFAAGDQIPVPWPDGWVWTGLAGPDSNTPSRFTYDEWVQNLRDNAEARRAKADSGRSDDLDELRRRLEELRNTPCADGETPVHHTTTTGVIMSELTRTYTVDQLEELGLPWENYLVRDSEDERRSYTNWRIIFRDPADDTTWSIIRAEPKNDYGEPSWWYSYRSVEEVVARRVEPREVTVTQWVEVEVQEASR